MRIASDCLAEYTWMLSALTEPLLNFNASGRSRQRLEWVLQQSDAAVRPMADSLPLAWCHADGNEDNILVSALSLKYQKLESYLSIFPTIQNASGALAVSGV